MTDPHVKWWRVKGVVPVFSMFFGEALVLGHWIPRIPDVKTAFDFTASQLGWALFSLALGTLVAFLLGTQLIRKLGLRASCMVSMPLWAMGACFIPLMPNGWIMGGLMFFCGCAIGLLEVSMNTAVDKLEQQSGRRLMSKAHGFWSIGSLVGALMGGALSGMGVDVVTHFAVVMPITAVWGIWAASKIPVFDGENDASLEESQEPNFKLPNRGLVLLCIMPIGIMVVEGAFIDWSAVFVREVLAGDAWASGLIYSAFSVVMAVTRLCGDWLQNRIGPLVIARTSAISASFGVALFALAPNVTVAFIAALFAGLGTAIFYPLTMSAAARRPGRSEDNVAAMSLFSFTSFMIAPPLLGGVADLYDLRIALLLVAPLAASSLILSGELKKPS